MNSLNQEITTVAESWVKQYDCSQCHTLLCCWREYKLIRIIDLFSHSNIDASLALVNFWSSSFKWFWQYDVLFSHELHQVDSASLVKVWRESSSFQWSWTLYLASLYHTCTKECLSFFSTSIQSSHHSVECHVSDLTFLLRSHHQFNANLFEESKHVLRHYDDRDDFIPVFWKTCNNNMIINNAIHSVSITVMQRDAQERRVLFIQKFACSYILRLHDTDSSHDVSLMIHDFSFVKNDRSLCL